MKWYRLTCVVLLVCCVLFSGCSAAGKQNTSSGNTSSSFVPSSSSSSASTSSGSTSSQSANGSSQSQGEQQATLVVDWSMGGTQSKTKSYPFSYTGTLTAEKLADGLTELTGLDFFITATEREDGIQIDWAANSTLVANLDDRQQKDEFHMYDVISMRWFMMDSLYQTIRENLGIQTVYYTMDGGKTLTLDELGPVNSIPADEPYQGSSHYASAG